MSTYGPYTRKDGRKIIIIDGVTISYPKYLLEQKLGRKLEAHETCDHIDGDFTNDNPDNLRVLSRRMNTVLGQRIGPTGYKQSEDHKRSGDKNGMAKLTKAKVIEYREAYKLGKITKKAIIAETGLSRKSVENFLNGVTYK